jgi:hypothetical protein
MLRNIFLTTTALATLIVSQADASMTISKKVTANVSCTAGVCTATGMHANMNATDLSTMLASSDVTVANGALTKDIDVDAEVSWGSTHRLTLDSRRAINIFRPISVIGTGAMTLKLNDGGADGQLNFYPRGHITFADMSSDFAIGNLTLTLVADIQMLAADVAANPSGAYALAKSYNAGLDGIYSSAPVSTAFGGYFEGLGNAIEKLRVRMPAVGSQVGLFGATNHSIITDLHLTNVTVQGGKLSSTGALAGVCSGTLENVDASGSVSGGLNSYVGGLCGVADGTLINVHSSGTVTGLGDNGTTQNAAGGVAGLTQGILIGESSSSAVVTGAKGWTVGGLIGRNTVDVDRSFATGTVSSGDNGISGGLIGSNTGGIGDSYATGFVGGGVSSTVGGFIGLNNAAVIASYSSGPVASGSGNAVGGFIGNDTGASDLTNTYFDLTSSGQSHGVGNNTAYPGITGLTTEEFQSGLPTGFTPTLWAEDPSINGGLPYLVTSPPG